MFRLFPVRVHFPLTNTVRKDVTSLTVLRHEYQMDTARLELNVDYDELNEYVSAGSPLRITWGAGSSDEFIGYVHSFRPQTDGFMKSTVIVAISAAYPLFNETGRTYTEVGIHNVAQQIGDDYRFQVETDPHPYVNDQILQKGDSDWVLLSRLAQQWGYILLMDGVTLIFRPMAEVLKENYLFSSIGKTNIRGTPVDPNANLISFHESYSATGSSPITDTGFYGVNPIDVDTVSQQDVSVGTALFQEIDVERSITSNLEGELKVDSIRARSQFPFQAVATIRAPYRKKPFDCYRIFNDGKSKTWVIRSIKHVVTGDDYMAEVIFGSDGMDHSYRSVANRLDINTLLKRNRRARRPTPMIINTRPFFVGAGANAVVPDQRWKARVMTVPVDDSEET